MAKFFFFLPLLFILTSHTFLGGWETDANKAMMDAKRNNKHILLFFTGSDWCGWCKKLDSEVFQKGDFKSFANGNLVTVLVDFPRQKQLPEKQVIQNETLAVKYRVSGYPTVIILDPHGRALGVLGYEEGGSSNYIRKIKQIIGK